ncbi:amylo-alpha-1,6-glucosidase [Alkalihalophilus lindianensis]|uniref:Amylo-alpha-1,6-glucosidase n=1 Tax=Alkalihalophilus lindianensis TaxID=1630542 RepID=A0ABU3XEA2_9BACI|nr:amylo-alpha-1,6-glucosidase [Alkalihalophilus lindianensis]MDV2686213.1 amylo-alpha-1,6-glucosidase [Alkalihalophilus lindianensis]
MNYRVIKENDLFLLTDEKGNIPKGHEYGAGLYTKDTRYLSKFDVRINQQEPVLLTSNSDDAYRSSFILTNPHMEEDGELILWRESVELKRERFIYDGVCYEELIVTNYYPKPVSFDLSVHMEADFQDMFIVRGFQHGEIGNKTGVKQGENELRFMYEGADQISRQTVIQWSKQAKEVTDLGDLTFGFELAHGQRESIVLAIAPIENNEEPVILPVDEASRKLKESHAKWDNNIAKLQTDHLPLQRLVDRGVSDMRVLLTDLGYGSFPVAGLPWFAVPFGRDSLIAALQLLPFQPEVAKGTLRTMAAFQGTKLDPWRDEQPGKIMHELRKGELANTNQVPFTPYYGTIDATPLFLILLSEYIKWTGDVELFNELTENVENALMWIDEYGDRDGDLFVEYHQESSKGIANQGWKDSADSVVHRNGDYAKTPIALAEVQGYVYQAKQGMAELFEAVGNIEKSKQLVNESNQLKEAFEAAFWMEDQQFYAIALDQDKKPVGTLTTNPGHVLFAGMLSEGRAQAVSNMLVSDKMFSGYGIRTMGEGEAGYNPMSYHDGSVWPHDNSMILLGMGKLGHHTQANAVIDGLIKAAQYFDNDRLPELFCGYSDGKPVIPYPVACSPQAWAAGTPLVMVQTMLGLYPDTLKKTIALNPVLPESMNELVLRNVTIASGQLDLIVRREDHELKVTVEKNTTGLDLQLVDQKKSKSSRN